MGRRRTIRKIYDLFTSDLSYTEIERLLKHDAPAVFDFYSRYVEKPDTSKNFLSRFIILTKNISIAFLRKLSPARRFLFAIAWFLFIIAFMNGNWTNAVYSFIILNILVAFELADKLTAKDELAIAAKIQNSLIPLKPPIHNLYDFSCYTITAREVGGDYYDFIHTNGNENNFYVTIGDISGKGMGAALHMMQVRVILHSILKNNNSIKSSLVELNNEINRIFNRKFFLTLGLIRFDDKNINYSRAGHTPLLHWKAEDKTLHQFTPAGIGIGITDNSLFENNLEEIAIDTSPGDIIVLYTDGITEAMNKKNELFDDHRLHSIIKNYADKSVEIIKDRIIYSVAQFSGKPTPADDLSLIVIKRK